jgi:hypothetical protein
MCMIAVAARRLMEIGVFYTSKSTAQCLFLSMARRGETLTFIKKCIQFATFPWPPPQLAYFVSLAGTVRCLGEMSLKRRFTLRPLVGSFVPELSSALDGDAIACPMPQ